MKLLVPCLLVFLVSACQITPSSQSVDSETNQIVDQYINDQQVFDEEALEIASQDKEGLSNLVNNKKALKTQQETVANQSSYENLWLKLAHGFEFEVADNSRIAKQRDYYLRHPNYLKQISKRAEPFLYLIVEQIEARNLPLELALLPIVESTFDPFAYSHASASGLWQFMPATGKRFGLEQDWWYDGRRDVYASTDAALRYMDILHKYLEDNWLYAIAAYNSGEGRVERAVRKNKKANKPVDYWNLDLPKETELYVPKLLALVDILRHHQEYGIELPFIENQQVLTYVDTDSQLDLAYAAKVANLTVAEIQLLNPAFNHWATSPDGPHKLLIPTVIADEFKQALNETDKDKRIRWSRYKVRSGDSLSVIARNHGTTTNVLKQINDINSSFIKVGQALLIPVANNAQQDYLYTQAKRFEVESRNSKHKITHNVVEGDTLWDISRSYKVTTKEIAKWNNMSSKKTLRLGQELVIWKATSAKGKSTRKVTYQVRSGDSLGVIAQKFKVKTTDLVVWNQLHNQKYIKPGQKLLVYVAN
tara:strand:+ start:57790 stop:59394 length:1605 start_codon:yes stop_codon:yes gene_type:complete